MQRSTDIRAHDFENRHEVERTFTDKASGKDTARPKLDELIAFVRDGDTVLVRSMDRLARNLDDLLRLRVDFPW